MGKSANLEVPGIAIEELDSYDAHFQPTLREVQKAQDMRNTDHLFGSNGARTPNASSSPHFSEVERAANCDATKDSMVKNPRASL